MPNLNEVREAVEEVKILISTNDKLTQHHTPIFNAYEKRAIGFLLALATEVIEAKDSKELREYIWERCEADDTKTDEIMNAIRLYQAKKMAELERIIAEFIPHRDSEYIKPLATAIREHLK